MADVEWHGTRAEGRDLEEALHNNCQCNYNTIPVQKCAAHEAFVHDQHWVDRLLFERRIRKRLQRGEWSA